METKTVICFYWQGDRWQEPESTVDGITNPNYLNHLKRVGMVPRSMAEKYVNNLFKGVTKHSSSPIEFICFTNDKLKVDKAIELRKFPLLSKRGVLPRMFMFSEEAGLFGKQVLCLDLDLVIVGSLDDILDYKGVFCTRMGFPLKERKFLDGDIMSFLGGPESQAIFWDPFIDDVEEAERITGGRERWWVRHVTEGKADTWNKLTPNQVCSYKVHVRGREIFPKNARIISCHGHPRPHQIEEEWRIKNWK